MAWFGCIDRTYTLLLRFMFWGASSKSDYLVSKVFAVDDESFSLDLDLSVRYGWS